MIFRTVLILITLLLIDLYVFQGIRFLIRNLHPQAIRIIIYAYWSVTVICFAVIIASAFVDWHDWPKGLRTYSFAFIFVTYFSKLFLVLFLIVDDIFRFFRWIYGVIFPYVSDTAQNNKNISGITRSDFIVKTGALIAAIPFASLLFGMMKGKYDYRIKKLRLSFAKLPVSFEGFRIVQISDIHTGSFMDKKPLETAVKMINDLKPDVIFFTGDLVNDLHWEALPFIDTLSKLKAPHGVYSILGNHDYGDYYRWENKTLKEQNLSKLISIHKQMGWDILLDEHRHININGESITVIGVQNWSARMNFARYGNLKKATRDIKYSPVNILLSHDPSHWRAEIAEKIHEIDLTLSGHTHGFQFGVEVPGFKWSPVQYVYKEWADLYSSGNQHLYVNRGLGFIGYPGRVGILPEITVFELNRG